MGTNQQKNLNTENAYPVDFRGRQGRSVCQFLVRVGAVVGVVSVERRRLQRLRGRRPGAEAHRRLARPRPRPRRPAVEILLADRCKTRTKLEALTFCKVALPARHLKVSRRKVARLRVH